MPKYYWKRSNVKPYLFDDDDSVNLNVTEDENKITETDEPKVELTAAE